MRVAFFMLLAANLAFLAWAGWIDRPDDSRLVESTNRLPRLWFAGEKPSAEDAAANGERVEQPRRSSPAQGADRSSNNGGGRNSGSASPNGNRTSNTNSSSRSDTSSRPAESTKPSTSSRESDTSRSGRASSGSASSESRSTPAVQAAANLRQASSAQSNSSTGSGNTRVAAAEKRCLTVGPFKDVARSNRAATLLRERGFTPKQRNESGDAWAGFWVYVGGLKSEAEQADVLRQLEAAGIADAHSMPDTGDGLQVSVGLFSDRGGADRRARAVQRLGLEADIMEKSQAGMLYWVDINPDSSKQAVPTEGLLALEETGTRLELKVCPRK